MYERELLCMKKFFFEFKVVGVGWRGNQLAPQSMVTVISGIST